MDPALIDKIYNTAKETLGADVISPANVLNLTVALMEAVEKCRELTGSQKKTLVVDVIKRLLDETNMSEEDNKTLDTIIELTVPTAIDVIIAATHGNVHINRLRDRLAQCPLFKCCKP